MKKILGLALLVLLFSCEPQETCKTCTTIIKYPNTDVMIIETTMCGELLDKSDGECMIVTNPTTGEIVFYRITTCK